VVYYESITYFEIISLNHLYFLLIDKKSIISYPKIETNLTLFHYLNLCEMNSFDPNYVNHSYYFQSNIFQCMIIINPNLLDFQYLL